VGRTPRHGGLAETTFYMKLTPLKLIILVIAGAAVVSAGLALLWMQQRPQPTPPSSQLPIETKSPQKYDRESAIDASIAAVSINHACFPGGVSYDTAYPYETYTVRRGDALNFIAARQLGDASRFNEIIVLNAKAYPTLTTNPGYLETGWVFRMPPKDIRINNENPLARIRGQIVYVGEDRIAIRYQPQPSSAAFLYYDQDTRYVRNGSPIRISDLTLEDCAKATIEKDYSRKTNYPILIEVSESINP